MFEFEQDRIYTRKELANTLGISDRMVRRFVREQRRAGVPIMGLKQGGYKLASNSAEIKELINQYRSRIIDEAETITQLQNAMQVEGQVSFEEVYSEGIIRY